MRRHRDSRRRSRRVAAQLLLASVLVITNVAGCGDESQSSQAWLHVSSNGHYLVTGEEDRAFVMQADSAWWWAERASRPDVIRYLDRRKQQGFNTIMITAKYDPGDWGNSDGEKVWEVDASQPNPAYFEFIDFFITEAEARGMVVGLSPAWVKHVTPPWGNALTMANAYGYGRWIGQRYSDRQIFWIMGGDDVDWHENIVREVARGVTNGVTGSDDDHAGVTMTYHPGGGLSSMAKFHDDPWLDFNMSQSGHCELATGYEFTTDGFDRLPAKPIIDGEPLYEGHPLCFDVNGPYSTARQVRNAIYNGVFGGGAGIAYGHHSVWQVHQPGRVGVNAPLNYWYEALDDEVANQLQYARELLESRPVLDRIPDGSLGTPLDGVRYTMAADGSYMMGYSTDGRGVEVDLGRLSGGEAQLWWYDPRTGSAIDDGRVPATGILQRQPPTMDDWVLVVDDVGRGFAVPGIVDGHTP